MTWQGGLTLLSRALWFAFLSHAHVHVDLCFASSSATEIVSSLADQEEIVIHQTFQTLKKAALGVSSSSMFIPDVDVLNIVKQKSFG